MGRKKEKSRKREESINAFFGTIVIFLIYYLKEIIDSDLNWLQMTLNESYGIFDSYIWILQFLLAIQSVIFRWGFKGLVVIRMSQWPSELLIFK